LPRSIHDRQARRDLAGAGATSPLPALAMLNPLRSESEAFRLLLYVAAVFAVIIALLLIARAIFS
jgi:hypothetical protein